MHCSSNKLFIDHLKCDISYAKSWESKEKMTQLPSSRDSIIPMRHGFVKLRQEGRSLAWPLKEWHSLRTWHKWLEPNKSKMAEDLTASRLWASEYTHCNTLAWVSLLARIVKNLPAMQETWVWSMGWEVPLEKGMATHYSILAWRIPWTEEPGRL